MNLSEHRVFDNPGRDGNMDGWVWDYSSNVS